MIESSSKKYLQIINFSDFESVFKTLIDNKKTFLAYFYGDYNNNGISWCGDCNDSKPIVEEASNLLKEKTEVVFYKFPIEQSSWRDKSFLYRTHQKLKLTNVPTMILFQKGSEFTRLVEGQLNDIENVKDLFSLIL